MGKFSRVTLPSANQFLAHYTFNNSVGFKEFTAGFAFECKYVSLFSHCVMFCVVYFLHYVLFIVKYITQNISSAHNVNILC